MAAGYNRVVMVGNLTRDPEHKQLSSGQSVCRLGLASNRQFRNRQTGDMIQEVCYVDIDVWGAQADSCNQYLEKGRSVLIEGRLKLDTWQDQQTGQNRSKHSIVADRVVFLSSNAETTNSEQKTESTSLEPKNEVERDLMNQIDSIKKRNTATAQPAKSKPQAQPKEVSFNDNPPFKDDLPFL